ncbi:MAG: ABC transporter permease [Mycobacterium leprae]
MAISKHLRDLWVLSIIQLLELRESWGWMVAMGPIFPLSVLLFLRFFAPDSSQEQITYIVTGNMVYSLVLNTTLAMGQSISTQKERRHFDYYISLPIHKVSFILAVMFQGLTSAIPGCIIVGLAGVLVFGLQLKLSVALVPFALLSLISLAGFGAFIGFWSPTFQVASYITQFLALAINFLSPTMMPMSALPLPLQWTSRLLPSTYAADGFRRLLVTGWSNPVANDCLYLLAFSVVSVWLVLWRVDWRGQE